MRLNLSLSVERYELIPGVEGPDYEIPAVAIWSAPCLSDVVEEAKADHALRQFGEEHAASLQALSDAMEQGGTPSPEMIKAHGKVGVLLAKAIARLTIERWEGVEDADGSEAPVTPDRVDAFMDHPTLYQKWTEMYLQRWFAVQSEKKGCAPSPTGTSVGAQNTAKPARKSAKPARAKTSARKR